jgi:hypothetical protein
LCFKEEKKEKRAFKKPIDEHVSYLSDLTDEFREQIETESRVESKAMEKAMLYWINT